MPVQLIEIAIAGLGFVAAWLGIFKSDHPDRGQPMWGGNCIDDKLSAVDRTVHQWALVIGALGLGLGILRVFGGEGEPRLPLTSRTIFGALAFLSVAVASLRKVLEVFAVSYAERRWRPAAITLVRSRLAVLEAFVRLGGVMPERESEMTSWPPEELARVQEMDGATILPVLSRYEALLEMSSEGTVAERVARLRSAVS